MVADVFQQIYDTAGVAGLLPQNIPDALLKEALKDKTCFTLLSQLCKKNISELEQAFHEEALKRQKAEAQRRIDIEKN